MELAVEAEREAAELATELAEEQRLKENTDRKKLIVTVMIIVITLIAICILACVIMRLVKRVKERRLNNVEIEVTPVEKVEKGKDAELGQSDLKFSVEGLDDYTDTKKHTKGLPFTGHAPNAPIEIVTGDYNSNTTMRHLLEPNSNITVLRDSIEVS